MKIITITAADQISQADLKLDPAVKFQTIDGFGVNINPLCWDEGALEPVMEFFHHDLEANLYRLDVYGQSNWIDPESQYDKLILKEQTYKRIYTSAQFKAAWTMARYLNEHGIKPYLNASGLVPLWMCSDDGITLNDYESFAEMMASMLHWARHMENIDFQFFGPLNETDWGSPEGPKVTGQEYAKCCEVLIDALDRWGLSDVKLVVAEQGSCNLNYTTPLLASQKLLGRIGVIGMHSYMEDRFDLVANQVENYEDRSTRFWMTEYGDLDETGQIEWKAAWDSTRRLLNSLVDGAQAGLVWDAFDNYHDHDKAWTIYGLLRRSRLVFTPKKRYFAAKQIYKFVKAGSQRVALHSNNTDIQALAFVHNQHGFTITGQNNADHPVQLNINIGRGENPNYKGYFTNEALNCALMGTFCLENQLLTVHIPAKTIFTFSQNNKK